MLKYILSFLTVVFFISCSQNFDENSNEPYMKVQSFSSPNNINITQILTVEFSSDIDFSYTSGNIGGNILAPSFVVNNDLAPVYLKDATTGSIVQVVISQDESNSKKIKITPFKYLNPNSSYIVVVTTALSGIDGKKLSEDFEFSFSPIDDGGNPKKQLNLVDKNPGASGIDIKTDISVAFSQKIAYSDKPLFSVTDVNTSSSVTGTFKYFNSSYIFTPLQPLDINHTYDVNFSYYPTDMYGNLLNTSNGTSWSFSVDSNNSSTYPPLLTGQGAINVGSDGYFVRNFSTIDGNTSYVAVAKKGGIDFYDVTFPQSEPILTKSNYSVSINSNVLDMRFDSNSSTLFVATQGDGVLTISKDSNVSSLVVNRYLENFSDIYGVGYFTDANSKVDKIYAVGPEIGLKVLSRNVNGSFNLSKEVTVAGKPLKVIGYDNSQSRTIFVSDYENGLRVYDENGTEDSSSPIAINGNIKHIALRYIDSSTCNIYVINSIGVVYYTDASNPTAPSPSAVYTLNTSLNDITSDGYNLYATMENKGITSIDSSGNMTNELVGLIPRKIVSSYFNSYDYYFVLLSKDGLMYVYQGMK